MLNVGNIDIKRDFGYAPKYVEAMYLMMQQNHASDYLICSGKSITLRNIITKVFDILQIPIEKIVIDQTLYRPTDITDIYGSNQKAVKELGWEYSLDFEDVLQLLLNEELTNDEI